MNDIPTEPQARLLAHLADSRTSSKWYEASARTIEACARRGWINSHRRITSKGRVALSLVPADILQALKEARPGGVPRRLSLAKKRALKAGQDSLIMDHRRR